MAIVFNAHVADTPAGNPFAPDTPSLFIPVASVVVWVILVKTVLIHKVGVEEPAVTVLIALTVQLANVTQAVPVHPAPAVQPDLCPCMSTEVWPVVSILLPAV